jgi:uncharacterized protein YbjT (DUF2867 family)
VSNTILVTGATRNVGREVVGQLASQGFYVRAAASNVEKARAMGWQGVEIVPFDYEVPLRYGNVFHDVSRLLLVMPPGDFEAHEGAIPGLIDHAGRAGVQHIVFISAMGTENMHLTSQWVVEQHLQKSGLTYTFLRSGWFYQNFSNEGGLRDDIRRGIVRTPVGDVAISMVDVRDVAAVAALALTENGHTNQIYSLGENLLDIHDIVAILSDVLGRPIQYIPISSGEARRLSRESGAPREVAKWWEIVYDLMRQGAYSITVPDVSRLLERPAISFEQFVRDYRDSW